VVFQGVTVTSSVDMEALDYQDGPWGRVIKPYQPVTDPVTVEFIECLNLLSR